MRSARFAFLLLGLATPLLARTDAATAAVGPLAQNDSPIRARQQVPDDPLAGLPSEDTGRPSKARTGATAGKNAATCAVDGKPANAREIGDLRATLALVQRGPRSWPCPATEASGGAGLRITVESNGKITAAEPVGAAPDVAAAIAKKLTGKSIAGRREGSTTGMVWLTFSPGKSS
jgi:hypothetical protein